ncbi:tryptophan--tRNA ligase [Candidatus Saccharibacteria bacterium]|nr:tryptophan--tRNA ligase [Candidatus Saccharibacteria bacterium]
MQKEVVLTGLRSNSEFHIGNYLGAILPMVEMQKKHSGQFQLNMFIPDLHSFTTPIDHGKLYQQSLENLKVFVAAGLNIDDQSTFIYRQSYIPAHSEMTWILDCFAYSGELSRMTEYKDKSSREDTNVSVGLFNYPVLMAADILLYGAKWVPVGEDQRQHVEFTRNLAVRMNNKFDDLFVVPEDNAKQTEFAGRSEPVRIRSLRNPDKKMSKSVEDPAGTILLSDSPDEASKKVMSATTDSLESINYDWGKQQGITNLLQILALLSDKPQNEVNTEWQGKSSYGELKTAVAEAVKTFLADFQSKLSQVDQAKISQKLESDEQAMTNVANQTLLKVQKAVGLRPS